MLETDFGGPYWPFPSPVFHVSNHVEGVGPADGLKSYCTLSVKHDTCSTHIFHCILLLHCKETMKSTNSFEDDILTVFGILATWSGNLQHSNHQIIIIIVVGKMYIKNNNTGMIWKLCCLYVSCWQACTFITQRLLECHVKPLCY